VAALATSFPILQAARVLQAGTGGLISTSAASLVRETAPEERSGEAFGLFDLLVSVSATAGPFIGGLVIAAFGWRALFLLVAVVAVFAAAVVGLVFGRGRSTREPRHPGRPIDVPGLAILALVIVAFLAALRGDSLGGLAVVGAVAVLPLLGLFLSVELRRPSPAVDPRLLARRPFAAAIAGVFGATIVLHGCFILVPLLVEELLREPPTTTGIVLLGIAGVGAVIAPFGGRASDRVGRRPIAIGGSLVTAAGLGVLALPGGWSSPLVIGVLLAIVGLGLSLSGAPRQAAAFETIEPSRLGMASGTYYTGRYLGGVVGASVAGAVLGVAVTAPGVAAGFAILAGVALAAAVSGLGLPGRAAAALQSQGAPSGPEPG
jgi:DHA2 family methylenomycin A resistance protein-like MFS transporter